MLCMQRKGKKNVQKEKKMDSDKFQISDAKSMFSIPQGHISNQCPQRQGGQGGQGGGKGGFNKGGFNKGGFNKGGPNKGGFNKPAFNKNNKRTFNDSNSSETSNKVTKFED